MEITLGKLLSVVIAAGYVVGLAVIVAAKGLKADSYLAFAGLAVVLCLPLALIWFPEDIATAIGAADEYDTGKYFDFPSVLVSLLGWLILVGGPILVVFYSVNG